MFTVSKEDIDALKKKNYQIIFLFGGPGTGKGTQCTKLVTEFKYTHISTGDLIREQIEKNTPLGQQCHEYTIKGELIPSEMIIYILVKAIITHTAKKFLIDGFPRSMEQAMYFENNIKEIGIILNIHASEDTCINRIKNQKNKRLDDTEEIIKRRLKNFHDNTIPVLDFYRKYGVVREINSEAEASVVYEAVKEQLYPSIYLIIGKKYSGKTTVGNILAKRMDLKVIDFKEFSNQDMFAKKKNDENFILNSLISQLRSEEIPRVLIEDFPIKKESYNYFIKNCKKFEKVFYLNVNDNIASERMNKLGFTHSDYIGCSELNKQLYEFDMKKEMIDFLKIKTNFVEVDVNNYISLVVDNLMEKISPKIFIFGNNDEEPETKAIKDQLLEHFRNNLGYEIIDTPQLIQESIKRQTRTVTNLMKHHHYGDGIPLQLIFDSLKPVLFKETNNKFILANFPKNVEELSEFENSICKIQKYIYVSLLKKLPLKEKSKEIYMKKDNRLFIYNKPNIDEYVVNDILGLNRDVTIVYGMPLSGKTTFNNHLKSNYNYLMIDFVEFVKDLKKIKANEQDPPGDPESVEFAYPELIEGFKKFINNLPLNKKICIENFFGNELITDVEQVKKIFEITGKLKQLYETTCRDEILLDRWKQVKGIGEEIGEEQKNEFNESLDKPKKILEFLRSLSYKITPINTDNSSYKSKLAFDANFGKNLIVIKHDYDLNIENTVDLFAAQNQALVVNVPQLIYKQFYLNGDTAKTLEDSFCEKQLNFNSRNLYAKYNPIHFDEGLVNELINQYVLENTKFIEDNGNFIILIGYLNSDILENSQLSFNLPLLEVKKLMTLGSLSSFIQLTSKEVKETEDEVAEKPYVEVPKPKPIDPFNIDGDKQEEGENPDAGAQNAENAENPDEAAVPKFKPENYEWTNYDGNPRNYIQTLLRLNKNLPFEKSTVNKSSFNQTLMQIMQNHVMKIDTEKNSYNGCVNLINID